MNKVTVLSLGFMVSGIGCISWAMFSMEEHSDYSSDAFPSVYTTEGVNVESDSSLVLSTPVKTLYPVYPAEGDNIGSLTIPAFYR